eukprot:m.225361 g.225361  ORF g.225361 m.225361 type:complete len:90 (+) comp17040_c3_seq1:385-654(+)
MQRERLQRAEKGVRYRARTCSGVTIWNTDVVLLDSTEMCRELFWPLLLLLCLWKSGDVMVSDDEQEDNDAKEVGRQHKLCISDHLSKCQ